VWEVDIITISFGFSEEVPVIRSALKNAERRDVILFAAANNEGGNRDIAWPARMSEVICIHSTDGRGNPSPFTPTALTDSNNFSILGQAVQSYWPPDLKEPGNMIRKSGTSTATPIAAGIAAVVLGYIGTRSTLLGSNEMSEDEEYISTALRSASGIRAVFRLMVEKRKEYDYVVPWKLINNDPRHWKEGTVCDMICQELRWRRS
jgi:subtilisin family serine protease